MDVNDIRIAVTVSGLALFLALMVHTYSRNRRAEHDEAAMLPFLDEAGSAPTAPAQPARVEGDGA